METVKDKGKSIGRQPPAPEAIPSNILKHCAVFMEDQMNIAELVRLCGLSEPPVTLMSCLVPPHMRGRETDLTGGCVQLGITPAHAGKSWALPLRSTAAREHPHKCREQYGVYYINKDALPLLEPNQSQVLGTLGRHGVINTILDASEFVNSKFMKQTDTLQFRRRGPTPHMRGTEPGSDKPVRPARITPAHAGKRLSVCEGFRACQDHPRTCGEKNEGVKWSPDKVGSPPHMRGKDCRNHCGQLCAGITPAHAGKSDSSSRLPYPGRDHPRTCGEKRMHL